MKLLVFSDSHGRREYAERMMEKESDCSHVFFLGDGIDDALYLQQLYKDKSFILVRGNNDFHSAVNTEAYKYIQGVTLMSCHGHLLDVRYSLSAMLNKAAAVRANIVLYGHTHRQDMYNDPSRGVCAVNPGAMCEGRYCVITVADGRYDIDFKEI